MNWSNVILDERQQKEVDFCKNYATQFAHGTVGHNEKIIIAKMATLLDKIEVALYDDGNFDEDIAPRVRAIIEGDEDALL